MNRSIKVVIFAFIGIIGVVSLIIIKEMRDVSLGYFGLLGVAMYLVFKNLFFSNAKEEEQHKKDDNDIVLKK